ncbi:MAG TPA: DUF1080 domain-containing protein, partial [Pirellulaceae bacterium]|nr:DUF1080 domain-containing protein [Pirellulaceae bacterium]
MTTAPTSSPSRSLTLRQALAANAQPSLAEVQEFPSGRTTWLGSPVTAFDCRRPLAMILAVASPWLLALLVGCGGQPEEGSSGEAAGATEATVVAEAVGEPPVYELDPVRLAAATLPPEQLAEGWVRLFDEQSLAGWFVVGNADWQVVDGTLQVTQGERSYLCTSFMLADYELKVDFRCDPETNSGIFLRTTPEPQSVEFDCLELNIAPPENPYPTGSFVQRQQLPPEKLPGFDPTDWHTYHIRVAGEQVQVSLDGEPIIELSDTTSSRRGHISLQHNQGRIAFRNILLRPVDARELSVGSDWQTDWTKSEKTENAFTVEPIDEGLHLVGGLG